MTAMTPDGKKPRLHVVRMPEDDTPFPQHADVWDADGTFSSAKAQALYQGARTWPPDQKAAMLRWLQAAEARARIKTRYRDAAALAASVDSTFNITPALQLIASSVERVLSRPRANLLVTMPPQEGKTSLCSVWTPIRALQLNPNRRIILATYGDALAETHSSTARDIIARHGTGVVDPVTGVPVEDRIGLRLSAKTNKVSAWKVDGGNGGMVAVGLGSSITGRPADLFIIDDPYKNMMEADSASHRRKVDEWFSSVVLTRLSPQASIILIQCMTGDTPVLRPDGTETPLGDIRPGDEIATYEDGALRTSTVKNWASQGYDSIYAITTTSGRTVRANARHPFLVLREGVETWVRLSDLRPGDNLISTAGGTASCVPLTGATPPYPAGGCACPTTTRCDGRGATSRSPKTSDETDICGTDTALASLTTTACSPSRVGCAQAVASRPAPTIAPLIGRASYASIIAMKQDVCAAFSAMTATSSSVAPEQPCGCVKVPTISTDTVVAIEPCGVAEVFDIEVERTENFIANGLVSHNTRWHPEDLSGKVIEGEAAADKADRTWRHINIPAIAEDGIPDALGRQPGEVMVSARGRTAREFANTRRQVGERVWYALYQGSPRIPSGGMFLRRWFDPHREGPPDHPIASVVGVDPADSGDGDETGIIGAMLDQDGTVVLTEDWSGQMTSDQWARQAVLLALQMGAREIALEAYAAATTYTAVLKRAYHDLHLEAVEKRAGGLDLTPVEGRALTSTPPFTIHQWRAKGDAVGRSALLRQALETGKCRTVEYKLGVFESQACDWQAGQHQPDRVAAALIAHDRLAQLGSGRMTVAAPVTGRSAEAPAWMRRRVTAR